LADQLNRAALSIAANIAEGNGRFTKPDRKNFFTIARGSAQECIPLLEVARRRGIIDEPTALALKEQLEIMAKMISGLIMGLQTERFEIADFLSESQKKFNWGPVAPIRSRRIESRRGEKGESRAGRKTPVGKRS